MATPTPGVGRRAGVTSPYSICLSGARDTERQGRLPAGWGTPTSLAAVLGRPAEGGQRTKC